MNLFLAIDPITLTGLALAGTAGFFGSKALKGGGQSTPAPTPTAPAPTASAPPQQQPQAQTTPHMQTPSFIGAAATPPTQSGQKTLLGS